MGEERLHGTASISHGSPLGDPEGQDSLEEEMGLR